MDRLFSSRWFPVAAFAVFAAAVVAAYSNTFSVPFQFDGVPQVRDNRTLRDLGNFWGIMAGNRPVTMLSFALNFAVGGEDTFGFHVVNTAIHIVNSALAFSLVYLTLGGLGAARGRAARIAFFSALLFALHPVQTQAVTYIIQRMESMMSMFFMAGVLLFIGAARAGEGHPGLKAALYGGVAVSYALAFYTKEVAITLPAVVFLYDVFFVAGPRARPLLRRTPFYALMAAMMVFFAMSTVLGEAKFGDVSAESIVAAPAGPAAVEEGAEVSPGQTRIRPESELETVTAGFGLKQITPAQYLYTQFDVIVYYFALLLYPANQNLDYDFPISNSLLTPSRPFEGTVLNIPVLPPAAALAIILALCAAAAAALLLYRRGRVSAAAALPGAFFLLWFFVILSPTSSVVPIIDVIYEHRLYLPSLGFFTIAVILLDRAAAAAASRLAPGTDSAP